MKKVTLFVYGNILCRDDFATTTKKNFDDAYVYAKPDEYDLSEAIVVNGNLICDYMDIKSHKVACTGSITAFCGDRFKEDTK